MTAVDAVRGGGLDQENGLLEMQRAVSRRRRGGWERWPRRRAHVKHWRCAREQSQRRGEKDRTGVVRGLFDVRARSVGAGDRSLVAVVRAVFDGESIVSARASVMAGVLVHRHPVHVVARDNAELVAAGQCRKQRPDEREHRQQCQKSLSALASGESHGRGNLLWRRTRSQAEILSSDVGRTAQGPADLGGPAPGSR